MRIEDISPRDENTTLRYNRDYQSVAGKALCCALSADGARAYLGGHSGVWRSDDGGATWWHPEWPQPPAGSTAVPGSLAVTNVYDLLISPLSNDVVLAATGRDSHRPDRSGIYRSVDGGLNWTLVHQFTRVAGGQTQVSQLVGSLAVAPDDPGLMFAAGGFGVARSTDAGATWSESFPALAPDHSVWYVVVGRAEGGGRRVYAAGSRVWYSLDGGLTWSEDAQPVSVGSPADGAGQCARSMAIHPTDSRLLYLAVGDVTLWRAEYTSAADGLWTQLAAPRADYPGTTASGTTFVLAQATTEGEFYLLVSDRRTLHFAAGEPTTTLQWTRIEDVHCHLDPHGLAITPDFHRQLPYGPIPPTFGRVLLVNDGGANYSTDGAQTWGNGRGVSTLGIVNVAINALPGAPPAICMGMGDNSGFSSPDGGQTWETQDYVGGDNDCCFADPKQPSRLLVFAPRHGAGAVYVYSGPGGEPPDASWGTPHRRAILYPPAIPGGGARRFGCNMVSNFVNDGYRPLVLTRAGEAPRPDGDLVTIRFTDQASLLLRTTRISEITSPEDWVTSATEESPSVKAFQQGPPLPSLAVGAVQASGGHASPVFYVGDGSRLWKWTAGMADWLPLVPGPIVNGRPRPATARRFFVDSYRPQLIYVLDRDHILRSQTGGTTWLVDAALERALTEDGAFPFEIPNDGNPGQALVRDVLFDPERPGCRFAVGPAGVFHTLDGLAWSPLIRSSAIAMRPNNAAYDSVSCPRALYVATSNRGLLRVAPLPPDWDYAMGSVQAAEGRITLLRVHDRGTKYGPPHDQMDVEVVVWLDSEPEKAFGFQLRSDGRDAMGKLALLRDAFNGNRRVRIDFVRSGCRNAHIIRVMNRD